MESKNVIPCNFNVLAEVTKLPEEEDGIYKGEQTLSSKTDQAYYYGTALKIGPRAKEKDQCPELEEGSFIIFSDLAGYHLTTKSTFCKLVRGHDIVALTTDLNNMNEKSK